MRPGRPPKNGHPARPFRTLAQIGLSKRQSSEWQRLAAIPEADFVNILRELQATGRRITTGGVLRAFYGAKARREYDAALAEAARGLPPHEVDQ